MSQVMRDATISGDGLYRYMLVRAWAPFGDCTTWKSLAVIGLNPSTADAEKDDPTIRKCMKFARAWGYNEIVMLNLFALRATDPEVMKAFRGDPIGPENDATIKRMAQGREVLCAWGNDGEHLGRGAAVLELLRYSAVTLPGLHLKALGSNKNGQPKHPLYLADSTTPEPFYEIVPRKAPS